MPLRNCAVCATVHTATLGRSPVRRHCSTRLAVHTTARGRRADGSTTSDAGFSSINPARSAAFNAARNVARIRCSVAVVTGRPLCWWSCAIVASIRSTCPTDTSATSRSPSNGSR